MQMSSEPFDVFRFIVHYVGLTCSVDGPNPAALCGVFDNMMVLANKKNMFSDKKRKKERYSILY